MKKVNFFNSMLMLWLCISPGAIRGQLSNALQGIYLSAGAGTSLPDRRLQNNLTGYGPGVRSRILNNANHTNDNWFYASIEKQLLLTRVVSISPALGYIRHSSDFPNIVNTYHFGNPIDILLVSGRYTTHNIMVAAAPEISIAKGWGEVSIGVQAAMLMLARKDQFTTQQLEASSMEEKPWASKSGLEVNSVTISPYVKFYLRRFYLMGGIRAFQIKWRDDAIWNTGEKTDYHNPFMTQVSLGFELFHRRDSKKTKSPERGG